MKIKRKRILEATRKSSEVLAFGMNGHLVDGILCDVQLFEPRITRARVTDVMTMAGNIDGHRIWAPIEVSSLAPLLPPDGGDLDTSFFKYSDVVLESGLPAGLLSKKTTMRDFVPKTTEPAPVNKPEAASGKRKK